MLTGPTLIEEVKRTNALIVQPTQRVEFAQHNSYAIKVDRERNCYSHGKFSHLAWNCKRQIISQGRRMEYEDNRNYRQNNLNKDENPIVLN